MKYKFIIKQYETKDKIELFQEEILNIISEEQLKFLDLRLEPKDQFLSRLRTINHCIIKELRKISILKNSRTVVNLDRKGIS